VIAIIAYFSTACQTGPTAIESTQVGAAPHLASAEKLEVKEATFLSSMRLFELANPGGSLTLNQWPMSEEAWQLLESLKSVESLRLQLPPKAFVTDTRGSLDDKFRWDSLAKLNELRRIELVDFPPVSLSQISRLKGVREVVIRSLMQESTEVEAWRNDVGPEPWRSLAQRFAEFSYNSQIEVFESHEPLPPEVVWELASVPALRSVTLSLSASYNAQQWSAITSRLLSKSTLKELRLKTGESDPGLLLAVAESEVESLHLIATKEGALKYLGLPGFRWSSNPERRAVRPVPALKHLEIWGQVEEAPRTWTESLGFPSEPTESFYGISPDSGVSNSKFQDSGIRLMSQLESIRIGESPWIRTDLLFASLASLPKVKAIYLQGCPGIAVADDFHWLQQSQSLSEITLKNCYNLTDDCLREIAKIPNLKKLNIDGCYRVSAVGIGHLKNAAHLEVLHWSGTYQADDAAIGVIAGLPKTLRELHLDPLWSNVGDKGRKAIALRGGWASLTLPGSLSGDRKLDTIKSHPSSEEPGRGWNDELLKLLAEHSPGLSNLRLAGHGVTSVGVGSLKQCEKLSHLTFTGIGLNKDLAIAIGSLKSLSHVWIKFAAGSGSTVAELAESEVILGELMKAREGRGLVVNPRPWEYQD